MMIARMAMLVAIAILFQAVPSANAQSTPEAAFGTYRVIGVASEDWLNVRAELPAPGAISQVPIMAQLPPSAEGIVATGRTGQVGARPWLEIVLDGEVGWVNARFLEQQMAPAFGMLPDPLTCQGTEPFWSIRRDGTDVELTTFEGTRRFTVASSENATMRITTHALRLADTTGRRSVAIFHTDRQCSDGMSDADYPIETIWIDMEGDGAPLSGCCYAR